MPTTQVPQVPQVPLAESAIPTMPRASVWPNSPIAAAMGESLEVHGRAEPGGAAPGLEAMRLSPWAALFPPISALRKSLRGISGAKSNDAISTLSSKFRQSSAIEAAGCRISLHQNDRNQSNRAGYSLLTGQAATALSGGQGEWQRP